MFAFCRGSGDLPCCLLGEWRTKQGEQLEFEWGSSCIPLLHNKYLMSTYYVPSSVLGVEELGMNKTGSILALTELIF